MIKQITLALFISWLSVFASFDSYADLLKVGWQQEEAPTAVWRLVNGTDEDAPPIHVGDLIGLQLELTHQKGEEMVPLSFNKGEEWGSFEIRAVNPKQLVVLEGEQRLSRQSLELTAWQVGLLQTPAMTVTLRSETGALQNIVVPPLDITVVSLLEEDGENSLRDIKPQAKLPLPPTWINPLLIGLFFLGLIALGFYFKPPQEEVVETAVSVDRRTPYEIALMEIERVNALALLEKEQVKKHYQLLIEALRAYLAKAHQLDLELTSREIRMKLAMGVLGEAEGTELMRLLDEADLVKFANMKPGNERAEKMSGEIRALIEQLWQGRKIEVEVAE